MEVLTEAMAKESTCSPLGKTSHGGRLVSAPGELKNVLLKEYKIRMRPRPLHPSMKPLMIINENKTANQIKE